MSKKNRKYVYLNNLGFEGTVFQTQILDWLHLYQQHDFEFDLIQVYRFKQLLHPGIISSQIKGITRSTKLYKGLVYLLPSKGFFPFFNALIISFKLFKYIFTYKEILIFSRAIIGKEILWLRRILPVKIIFYFDGRAAAAEERKYIAIRRQNFSLSEYKLIALIYRLEYLTLNSADKVFTVSNNLKDYFNKTFGINHNKFISYPCLSDDTKFYFDTSLRDQIRSELKISPSCKVFLYSGGVSSEWHVSEKMFQFFDRINTASSDIHFLFLTADQISIQKMSEKHEGLFNKISCLSVPNNQVVKYLNAADFGILFRENTIMNNVASPTKFAEYVLCGLPIIISEGVGDYTKFTAEHHVGFIINENDMNNSYSLSFTEILRSNFDRNAIAELGKKSFAKQSIINELVIQFKS